MARNKKADAPEPNYANSQSTADELRSFVERFERLDEDAKAVAEDKKELMAEAKGRGYDTKVMRKLIAERKRDKDEVAEEEAILELYRAALGMGLPDPEDEDGDDSGMV